MSDGLSIIEEEIATSLNLFAARNYRITQHVHQLGEKTLFIPYFSYETSLVANVYLPDPKPYFIIMYFFKYHF
jgi:hypothetical protein